MSEVCFARVDRIGDLILTLPCEKFWNDEKPGDKVTWLVSENLKFVMDHVAAGPRAIYVPVPRRNIFAQFGASKELARRLRSGLFETVVAFHVPWWVALAFWMARIRRRVGVASQWFSWIFFNSRLRQKRSQALKHESRYNGDLVAFALGKTFSTEKVFHPVKLKPNKALADRWRATIKKRGGDLSRMVIVHPGMAGSARNWPAPNYKELAEKCQAQKISVLVTGSETDRSFVHATGILSLPGVLSVLGETGGEDLIALLSLASAVVAPSTGVAHLAASVGVPLAGIYSPVKVQAPLRWGPLGEKVKVFVPQVSCPGTMKCLGLSCSQYDCLEKIPVESVAAYVMGNL